MVTGVDPENVIAFVSKFHCGAGEEGLSPPSDNEGWSWTLIRDTAEGEWRVDDYGYG